VNGQGGKEGTPGPHGAHVVYTMFFAANLLT